MTLWELRNSVRHYAWGSPTALPELLGEENPRGDPWAEMWIGAHPAAPSRAVAGQGQVLLPELIAGAPERILGPGARRAASELPFLLKVLAVASPLSIQCHPDRERARAGFEREEARGIPKDAPERCYRDPRPKPELLIAHSHFAALIGFRPAGAIAAQIERFGVAELSAESDRLARDGDVGAFFKAVMEMSPRGQSRAVEQAAERARATAGPEASWVAELAARYPGDPGALSPLFFHLVELAPGEALYVPPGELHSYLEGVGVEIMACSDNVVRGGLTQKHVALRELFSVASLAPRSPHVLRGGRPGQSGLTAYPVPASEFAVARVDVEPNAPRRIEGLGSAALFLCMEGSVSLRDGASGARVELARGASALLAADVSCARIEGEGWGYLVYAPGREGEV